MAAPRCSAPSWRWASSRASTRTHAMRGPARGNSFSLVERRRYIRRPARGTYPTWKLGRHVPQAGAPSTGGAVVARGRLTDTAQPLLPLGERGAAAWGGERGLDHLLPDFERDQPGAQARARHGQLVP